MEVFLVKNNHFYCLHKWVHMLPLILLKAGGQRGKRSSAFVSFNSPLPTCHIPPHDPEGSQWGSYHHLGERLLGLLAPINGNKSSS